jgi:hypothetical protein
LRSDKWIEFTAPAVCNWQMATHHIDLGASWQNVYVERFNG